MSKVPIPLIGLYGNEALVARFMKYVRKEQFCWYWTGGSGKNVDGSRRAHFRLGRCCSASRASYALLKGDVPEGALVLHSCDDGMCVNPGHLRLGTNADNTADMLLRGRASAGPMAGTRKRGYKRPFMNRVRKLSDDDVRAIRCSGEPIYKLAAKYGITKVHTYAIKTRRRKGAVPD